MREAAESANDVAVVSNRTLSGCRLQVLNAGAGVARNVDVLIQGW